MKKYLIMISLVFGFLFTNVSALTISQTEGEFTQTVKDYITIKNGDSYISNSKWGVDYTIDFNTLNIEFEENQMDIEIDVKYDLFGEHNNTFYLSYKLVDNEFVLDSMKWGYFPLIKPLRESITKDLTIINMQANNLVLFDKEVINQNITTTSDEIVLDLSLNVSSLLENGIDDTIDLFDEFSKIATSVSESFVEKNDNTNNDITESKDNNSDSDNITSTIYTNDILIELLNENKDYFASYTDIESLEITNDYIKFIYDDYDLKISGNFDVENNSLVYSYDKIQINSFLGYITIPDVVLTKIQESFLENIGDVIDSENQNVVIPNSTVETMIENNNDKIEITSIEKDGENIIISSKVA